jgi:hypothetical protein
VGEGRQAGLRFLRAFQQGFLEPRDGCCRDGLKKRRSTGKSRRSVAVETAASRATPSIDTRS